MKVDPEQKTRIRATLTELNRLIEGECDAAKLREVAAVLKVQLHGLEMDAQRKQAQEYREKKQKAEADHREKNRKGAFGE